MSLTRFVRNVIMCSAFGLLVGCATGLSAASKTSLVNAARLTEKAYHYQKAGSAPAALDRGAHCAIQAVLKAENIGQVDSGVPCAP